MLFATVYVSILPRRNEHLPFKPTISNILGGDFKEYRVANDFYENEDSFQIMQVEENERFDPHTGAWSAAFLHPSDPAKYEAFQLS